VSFYDWLLALHVLAAFALTAALTIYWIVAVAARGVERPVDSARYFRITQPANIAIIVGTLGTLLLGIWLAIDADAYKVWDGWVIAAIVLWAISAESGRRGGVNYMEAQKLAERLASEGRNDPSPELVALLRNRNAALLNVASTVAILLILIDMLWKPGA
jgi:predicted integral membrane protein DUF2269